MPAKQGLSERVIELWNVWEIRGMILLSLCLQIILIIFGSRRKHTVRLWIWVLVWLAYTSADWTATIALGNMARNRGACEAKSSNPSDKIQAFWVPFLLLHLGGPDTITAYSLEDNELWLRHFLALVIQVGVAFYVFFRSWNATSLTFISIPVFISGIVKYGERSWVLRSSSSKHFRESLLMHPEIEEIKETGEEILRDVNEEETGEEILRDVNVEETDANYLCQADYLFKRFTYLFADLILDHDDRLESYSIIHNKSPADAFKLIAIELGFMYDVLYTKAILVYSRLGITLRCISFLSSISALVVFSVCIDKHAFPMIDISITYILSVGAVVIEIYAFIVLIDSDWTMLWLNKHKHSWTNSNRGEGTQFCQSHLINRTRWSGSMGQHNLIQFCIKTSYTLKGVISDCKFPTWKHVNEDLQALIFQQLLLKGNRISDDRYSIESCKQLLAQRGDYVLERRNCLDDFRWSTTEVEFDHGLLLWHIATDLCYHEDMERHGDSSNIDSNCKSSKCLSDYILYLLIMCPNMLPKSIGEIRYRDTCTELKKFLERKYIKVDPECFIFEFCNDEIHAWKELLSVKVDMLAKVKRDQNKSVLFHGVKLAKQLQMMESQEGWDKKKKWEVISEVWVEMLAYAASHCGWKEHGQQLRNGGELLTHVCLLMAHLGLSEQYQIQKQYIKRPDMPNWVKCVCFSPLRCCYWGCICCGIFCLYFPVVVLFRLVRCVAKPIRENHNSDVSEAT